MGVGIGVGVGVGVGVAVGVGTGLFIVKPFMNGSGAENLTA